MNKYVTAGRDAALPMIDAIVDKVHALSHDEQAEFLAGLFSALCGATAHCIGLDETVELLKVLQDMAAELQSEKPSEGVH
jgi:hypothetical protein